MALMTSLLLARKVLKKAYVVESQKVEDQSAYVIGRVDKTTEQYELYRQLSGYTYAEQTDDGEEVKFDSQSALYQLKLQPVMVTKGAQFSKQMQFTNQYEAVTKVQPQWARAFRHTKNNICAQMDVTGFTATTYGVNSEALYSTSHAMGTGGPTYANRPAVDIAFSPAGVKQMLTDLRRQKSARNIVQAYTGNVIVKVPPELESDAIVVIKSQYTAGTLTHDTNQQIQSRVTHRVIDYYTSGSNWFARAEDEEAHGLVLLEQMGYDIERLPRDKSLMDSWVASESYQPGWYDAHGTWGSAA